MSSPLQSLALPLMPTGFALWLIGAGLDSFGLVIGGLLLLIGSAVAWNAQD